MKIRRSRWIPRFLALLALIVLATLVWQQLAVDSRNPVAHEDLHGQILDFRGQVVGGADVTLFRNTRERPLRETLNEPVIICTVDVDLPDGAWFEVSSTTSGRLGHYRFEQVPAGRYLVRVVKDGLAARQQEVRHPAKFDAP